MNASLSDVVLLAHAGFGVTGCLAALWVLVETLSASPDNAARTGLPLWLLLPAWPQPGFAADTFFITGILAFLLPVAARENLSANAAARRLVSSVAALIVITGLAVEGAGAVIDHGVKIALRRGASRGAQ
jgi:hypothetical protein